jgi:hypothetical protein
VANDERIRARVEKLLRTAAPNSGASDNERQMAALEAARLFAEHSFTVGFAAPKRPRQPRPATTDSQRTIIRWPETAWTEVDIAIDCVCGACGKLISVGEPAWYDPMFGVYRHYDITCDL